MICDKYTLVSLIISNTINIFQFILYSTCMILNYNHPDIYIIRSLIYTKLLYDIFSFYKLYICFDHLDNVLSVDINDFIKYCSRFVHIPQISSIITYYRIYTMYDAIQTYTNPLMYVLYSINYYIVYLFIYIASIMFMLIISNQLINKINGTRHQSHTRLPPTNNICSICLDTECNYKTMCGHHFHIYCLLRWVTISNKQECPICRTNISRPIN
jgi:hypothetical protein